MFNWLVVLETDLSEEVETEECEYYDPDCKIYLSVEESPVICLVSDAEELQSESDLDKSENNLY